MREGREKRETGKEREREKGRREGKVRKGLARAHTHRKARGLFQIFRFHIFLDSIRALHG